MNIISYKYLRFCQNPSFITALIQRSTALYSVRTQWRSAAVLVGLVQNREQKWEILLTLRRADLPVHAGEVSFVGGKIDPEDDSAVAAALRETEEEIGIKPENWQIIGELPQGRTPSGFVITPVLALCTNFYDLKLSPNEQEVEQVFTIPIEFVLDGLTYQKSNLFIENQYVIMPELRYFGHKIWGVTALILYHLQQCWEVYNKENRDL